MTNKLIALDLDGTTLNDQSQIDPLTIKVLRQLDRLGHRIIIVTGRPYRNSKHLYDQVGLKNPMVNFNGALCHDPNNLNWDGTYHVGISKSIALDVATHREALNSYLIIAEAKYNIFATSQKLPTNEFFPEPSIIPLLLNSTSLLEDPTALTIFTSEEDQESTSTEIIKQYGETVDVRTWGGKMPCLEVVSSGVNKGRALKHLADYYKIDMKDTMAFGDEFNDTEMLHEAGRGVAMANGQSAVKAIADDITNETNDQNGLANYLMEYFSLSI